jgi:hypothetical protein
LTSFFHASFSPRCSRDCFFLHFIFDDDAIVDAIIDIDATLMPQVSFQARLLLRFRVITDIAADNIFIVVLFLSFFT